MWDAGLFSCAMIVHQARRASFRCGNELCVHWNRYLHLGIDKASTASYKTGVCRVGTLASVCRSSATGDAEDTRASRRRGGRSPDLISHKDFV